MGTCSTTVVDTDPSHPVLVLAGELDYPSAPEAFDCVDRLLAGHPKTLTFDLTRLEFLGSGGVSIILHAVSSFSESGTVIIRKPAPDILRLLKIAGVTASNRVRIES